jgi:hypothetical protein
MVAEFMVLASLLAGWAGGIILLVMGISRIRKWKLMESTPTRKVIDIEPGLVEVKGLIKPIPGKELTAPVSGTRCISYQVRVQEWESGDDDDPGRWKTIKSEREGGPFLIRDDSGYVKVVPGRNDLERFTTVSTSSSIFNDMTPNAERYIESRGIRDKGFFGILKRKLRVLESVVLTDRNLYVLGTARETFMEPILSNDYKVSPYVISNEGRMILSYDSEEATSSHMKFAGISLVVLGSFLITAGTISAIYFGYFF